MGRGGEIQNYMISLYVGLFSLVFIIGLLHVCI